MLYALLGIPAVVLAFVLLTMGPIGWFLGAFLGIAVLGAASVFGDDADDGTRPEWVNCPQCESRTGAVTTAAKRSDCATPPGSTRCRRPAAGR